MCLRRCIEDLRGMSNFCVYEPEDNVWDEFGGSDDHIVPRSGDEHKDWFSILGGSCKKPRHESHGSTNIVNKYGNQGKEDLYLPTLKKKQTMLEKGSWSLTPEGVFPSCDSDSCKEEKGPTSDDHCFKNSNIDSSGSDLQADDTIFGNKCVVEDDSVCQYPINHLSQTDNELSFLDNDGWLDIGNFEDVDRMFSSCDSTFGMGSLNNEEEFGWLASSHATEGSDDALKSDFKFPCAEVSPLKISDYNIDFKGHIEDLPTDESNKEGSPVDKKLKSQIDIGDGAVAGPLSVFSASDIKSGKTDDLMSKEKRKLPRQSEGKRKNDYLENGDSVYPCAPLKQYGDVNQPYEASSSGITSHASIQKHKPSMDSDSLGCVQPHIRLMHPECSQAPNHSSFLPTLSGSRSELDGHPSPSLKESSYASNIESSQGATLERNEKRERLYHNQDVQPLSRSLKNENVANPMQFHYPGSAQQQAHQFENENEGHSEVVGVSIGFSPELDSSNVQESSSMSSALDEISLEATSFRQLQLVMDQLDIKTKLCIRDSLYRLAKSAEQRHNHTNRNGDDVEACQTMMAQDTSRCTGLVDIETDTNPIDRSIAHLLFHRPGGPSRLPLNDGIPLKSNAMESGTNQPLMNEKQVFKEEASTAVEKKSIGSSTS